VNGKNESSDLNRAPEDNTGRVMRTCPTCSSPLEEQRCKLTCSRCGFFLSCSDFY